MLSLSLANSAAAQPASALTLQKTSSPIFIFHTDEFWLNLHHFLHALGRAQTKTPDSSREGIATALADQDQEWPHLSAREQASWREAVNTYAKTLSKQDLVFDDALPGITAELARAGDAPTFNAGSIDTTVASALLNAAPIYRGHWWRKHLAGNQEWQRSMQLLLDQRGAEVLAFITRAYQLPWPANGYDVHVSAYANWSGAYSTRGHLLVLASRVEGNRGTYGMENMFHEAMHQWDSEIFDVLRTEARKQHKLVPRDLSHAMIFFTAGEAVRHAFPNHVPYAIKFGVWERGIKPFKAALDEFWSPYLNGQIKREAAIAEIIKQVATEPQ